MTQDYSLGIDIGGTFTDLVIHDHASGRRWGTKVLTTHADPQLGVIAGVRAVLGEAALDEPAVGPGAIGRVVHATTLFTNALIERKGAPTGLLVTQGFRDMLEIARERKYDLYDIGINNPPPLVPRNLRREVSERMRADGAVAEALDEAQLLRQAETLRAAGCTSIALVFLHAYANPAHEIAAARAIAAQMPEMFVTPSHEVVREIREYERASTTVASAYIKPIAAHYLAAMERELAGLGITAPLLLMLSGGGLTHAAEVNRNPVQMLESGPAAGALAAAFFGARDGVADLLAFDMGGTTAKLSLIDDGEPPAARPQHQGRRAVAALERGPLVAGRFQEAFVVWDHVLQGVGRRYLVRIEGQNSQPRVATVRAAPAGQGCASIIDFDHLEFLVLVLIMSAAVRLIITCVLGAAAFFDGQQRQVQIAPGFLGGGQKRVRPGGVGPFEGLER